MILFAFEKFIDIHYSCILHKSEKHLFNHFGLNIERKMSVINVNELNLTCFHIRLSVQTN